MAFRALPLSALTSTGRRLTGAAADKAEVTDALGALAHVKHKMETCAR